MAIAKRVSPLDPLQQQDVRYGQREQAGQEGLREALAHLAPGQARKIPNGGADHGQTEGKVDQPQPARDRAGGGEMARAVRCAEVQGKEPALLRSFRLPCQPLPSGRFL